ncbi:MAG TPA: stage II sporulation protein M [Smithella sp.]|nr:stage II sporulation protein M [Smithella sp.]
MIIDLQKFLQEEETFWKELESGLNKIESEPEIKMTLDEVKRFQYLYQRAAADLAKITTFSAQPEIRHYLESLVARSYGEVHENREKPHRFSPLKWFFVIFPQTFRRHIQALLLALAIIMAGCIFGGAAITIDPDAKAILIPFSHLQDSPTKRVMEEETNKEDRLQNTKMRGTAFYMTHNTHVSIFMIALGATYGIGTVLLLFYNGVMLGAVVLDYILASQTTFVVAWLSPHGVIEIPALLLAGQTGLVLASAMIGWGERVPLKSRLRKVSGDIVTLIFGIALMLTWAGFIEAFISQYHEPIIPYALKTGFAIVEFIALVLFLGLSGTKRNSHGQ